MAAPTPKAPEAKEISPADLKPGHRIVTGKRLVEVKTVEECRGQWRTHVHVNGTGCYDTRIPVEIR